MSRPTPADIEKLLMVHGGDSEQVVRQLVEEDGLPENTARALVKGVLAPQSDGSAALASAPRSSVSLPDIDTLLEELAKTGGDDLAVRRRTHRIYEVIKLLVDAPAETQHLYRDAIVTPGYIKSGDWRSALADAKRRHEQSQPLIQVIPQISAAVLSDDGNAIALVKNYGDRIRYCPERGRWLTWAGNRWEWCPASGGDVREFAKELARELDESGDYELKHKQRSLSAAGTTSALAMAATDPRAVVSLSQLDANPWELNTPAGIIDLRTGKIHDADPEGLHTRITACAPDFETVSDVWTEFLADTFGKDDQLIDYVQRLMGYSAVGEVREHVLPFAIGDGGNGKGVLLEAARAVMGDYATTAPGGFLVDRAFPVHDTEIARLAGMRFVVCSETKEGDKFDEEKVKRLTGGDTISAHFMRQDYFTFSPSHTLWLMANHKPAVSSGGRSFWRRTRLIPFKHTVPDDKIIENLQGILADEHGPVLLAWIIRGAVAYAQRGLKDQPDAMSAATKEYEKDQDTVLRFAEDRLHISGNPQVPVSGQAIRREYERWCNEEGEVPLGPRLFSDALMKHADGKITKQHAERGIVYHGVGLVDSTAEEGRP